MLYNGWERWITTTGAEIKIGDGSKKTFQTVMVSWHEDVSQPSKMGEKEDDEETWGLEGGYSLVVLANANKGAVPGSIPGLGFHFLCYHDMSEHWRNTSQCILQLASVADLGKGWGVRGKPNRAKIGVRLANHGPLEPHFY